MSRIKLKKRYIGVAAVFLVAAGYIAYARASSGSGVQYQTAQAQKGMIAADVSGSGNVSIGNSANVVPAVSGTVTNLAVKAGDTVKKGQVLFTISNDQLDTSVAKSYASVLQAQQSLDSAQASEAQAQSDLDNANGQAGSPAAANIAALQAQVNAAQTQVNIAQSNYNTSPTPDNSQKLSSAQASLAQAQANLVKAEQQNDAAGESIQADSAKLGASQAGVTAAEQNLAASQADYQNQQNTASQRTVTAPIDGTITSLNVQNGSIIGNSGQVTSRTGSSGGGSSGGGSSEGGSSTGGSSSGGNSSGGGSSSGGASAGSGGGDASAGSSSGGSSSAGSGSSGSSSSSGSSGSGSSSSQAAAVIEDLGSLQATAGISEVDITKIAVGQKVTFTFDAIDGLTLTGKVEKIDTAGTVSSGVVTYNVTMIFDSIDPRVKPGMSVTSSIITDVKQDVLMVPNSAVKSQGSGHYVEILDNGSSTPRQQPVNIGIANDTDTEITSGLNEGDTVVTQTINPGSSSQQSTPASGFGGLGGGRAGGFGGGGLAGGRPGRK